MSALVETTGLLVFSENVTVMVSPSENLGTNGTFESDATIDMISGPSTRVLSAIPPRFVITPFGMPSASPMPPSVILRTITLSPSTVSMRSSVLSTQRPFSMLKYLAPGAMAVGYVIVMSIVSPGERPVTVQDTSPCGTATPIGFGACILSSDTASSTISSPLLGVNLTVPVPVGDSIVDDSISTVMIVPVPLLSDPS